MCLSYVSVMPHSFSICCLLWSKGVLTVWNTTVFKWGLDVMDPPARKSETLHSEDASVTDLPMPLRDDLPTTHIYEDIQHCSESNETHLDESSFSALRLRLPSDCLPGRRGRSPPPVPSRVRVPRGNITRLFSCDITEHAHKLDRSRTEVDNHVSMWHK